MAADVLQPSLRSRREHQFSAVTSVSGVACSRPLTVPSRASGTREHLTLPTLGPRLTHPYSKKEDPWNAIIAGFFTGGALAVRGGARAVRNGAIGCAILLAVIEGVGIGFQRMMAENTRLDVPPPPPSQEGAKAIAA